MTENNTSSHQDKLILAEIACERLVRRFAMLNDQRDHDELASLFVEDGTFSLPLDPDNPLIGRDTIRAYFRSRPLRLTRHVTTNTLIEVMSTTEARGRSYLLFVSSPDSTSPQPVKADPTAYMGEYDDIFVLSDDGWKFKERRGSLALKIGLT